MIVLAGIPDPSRISVDECLPLPLARREVRLQVDDHVVEAVVHHAPLLSKNLGSGGDAGLRHKTVKDSKVAAHWLALCAEGEFRSLMTSSDEVQQGVDQLVDCLNAPFRDVVADAAFALSLTLRLDSSRADESAAYLTTANALLSVKALQARAAEAVSAGEFQASIAIAKEILGDDPDPTQAWAALNLLLWAFESDPGSATTEEFQGLISPWLDSTDTATRGAAALILARFHDMPSGDFQRAEDHATQALYGHGPSRGEAWVTLAGATWRLDGSVPALRMLSHVASPHDPRARCAADVLRARIHQNSRHWEDAAAACESALSTDWSDQSPLQSLLDQAAMTLIDVLPRALDREMALLRLEELNCTLPDFSAGLADLHQISGHSDVAIELWIRAIRDGWRAFTDTFCAIVAEVRFPDEILHVIAASDDRRASRVLAQSPACPPEILCELGQSSEEDTRSEVAAHPSTPPKLLAQLATDSSTFVVLAVASNSQSPIETLQALSLRPEESIRRNTASNASTPLETLQMLVEAPEASIRAAVRDNPSSPDTLKVLAAMTL